FAPATLKLAEDSPEEAAVHPTRDAPTLPTPEGLGLGVLHVVSDLVKERVEELLQRASASATVVRVDAHQAPDLGIACEAVRGRPDVDIDRVLFTAGVNLLESGAEQRSEYRHRGLEPLRGLGSGLKDAGLGTRSRRLALDDQPPSEPKRLLGHEVKVELSRVD